MSADLLERRRYCRNEPQPLTALVANRPARDWLDRLVSVVLPRLIVQQKAANHHGVSL